VEGTITAVPGPTVTITRGNGTSVVLTVTTTTVIRLDGAASTVGSLLMGMRAEAVYQVTSAGNNAIRIAASDILRVQGTITAVAATATPPTVTITRANGTSVTLTVVTATVIRLDGAASVVGNLLMGMRAEAVYQLSTANNAIRIEASDKFRVEGTITAVAATATPPTVTITRANGTSVTLTVVTGTPFTTVIRLDGAASVVGNLLMGMQAEATYQLSTANNAIRIAANDILRVSGSITAPVPTAPVTFPVNVTITPANSTTGVVLIVQSTTTIRINGRKSTVDKLVAGMRAEAVYQVTSTGNNAISITAGREHEHEHEHDR
jgi:hypothetical protein